MVKKLQALKAKKGFTLVELIVVIAIIGVLAAILVPVLMGQLQKASITSLDATASTVVETVNTWIADRYSQGYSGSIDSGTGGFVFKNGTVTGSSDTGKWSIGGSDDTSLAKVLSGAYNFASDDYVKFWIEGGSCVAAVYLQKTATDYTFSVTYSKSGASGWGTGLNYSDKDNVVTVGENGPMVGTYPKYKGTTAAAGGE